MIFLSGKRMSISKLTIFDDQFSPAFHNMKCIIRGGDPQRTSNNLRSVQRNILGFLTKESHSGTVVNCNISEPGICTAVDYDTGTEPHFMANGEKSTWHYLP